MSDESTALDRRFVAVFGVALFAACIVLAYVSPRTFSAAALPMQFVMAIAAACIGCVIPGIAKIRFKGSFIVVPAGLAVMAFILVGRFVSPPPQQPQQQPEPQQQQQPEPQSEPPPQAQPQPQQQPTTIPTGTFNKSPVTTGDHNDVKVIYEQGGTP